jgi:phosphatidylserine/phosphatidylglycerophosphate/cardiolipin synthase-like enzyme
VTLIVLPDDGIDPVLEAIARARQSIRITLFRCDMHLVERALSSAVTRGVRVHALIAHTNRAGEKLLRRLELRLLGAGITVSRTQDDLVRYHDKLLIVDERVLYVLGFNLTRADARASRTMGLVTRQARVVEEAVRLFDADAARQPYTPRLADLVVSPLNARERLEKLIAAARRELLIYDPRLIDVSMLRLLQARARAGVDVRVIGRSSTRAAGLRVDHLTTARLHVRAILRDGRELFVGSQSLRALELDRRREVGLVVRDARALRRFKATFEADWASTPLGAETIGEDAVSGSTPAPAAVAAAL